MWPAVVVNKLVRRFTLLELQQREQVPAVEDTVCRGLPAYQVDDGGEHVHLLCWFFYDLTARQNSRESDDSRHPDTAIHGRMTFPTCNSSNLLRSSVKPTYFNEKIKKVEYSNQHVKTSEWQVGSSIALTFHPYFF